MRAPLHPGLAAAVRRMPVDSIADVWRALAPVAAELGVRQPSYSAAVRLVHAERKRRARLRPAVEEVAAKLIAGRVPSTWSLERLRDARRSPPPPG